MTKQILNEFGLNDTHKLKENMSESISEIFFLIYKSSDTWVTMS